MALHSISPFKEHNGSFSKGDKVLCLLELRVLPLSLWEGESGAVFQKSFSWYAPDSPSPSACRRISLKWSMMAFDPTLGKTQRR